MCDNGTWINTGAQDCLAVKCTSQKVRWLSAKGVGAAVENSLELEKQESAAGCQSMLPDAAQSMSIELVAQSKTYQGRLKAVCTESGWQQLAGASCIKRP